MMERRKNQRQRMEFPLNHYVDGLPYPCKGLDLSWEGVLMERIADNEDPSHLTTIEIILPDGSGTIWVWARKVWSNCRVQAMRFVGMDAQDGFLLEQFLTPTIDCLPAH
jgi:hypothetical protein